MPPQFIFYFTIILLYFLSFITFHSLNQIFFCYFNNYTSYFYSGKHTLHKTHEVLFPLLLLKFVSICVLAVNKIKISTSLHLPVTYPSYHTSLSLILSRILFLDHYGYTSLMLFYNNELVLIFHILSLSDSFFFLLEYTF